MKIVDLPLHYGSCPKLLYLKMEKLAEQIFLILDFRNPEPSLLQLQKLQNHKNQRFLGPENSERIFKDSMNFDSSKTESFGSARNPQESKILDGSQSSKTLKSEEF